MCTAIIVHFLDPKTRRLVYQYHRIRGVEKSFSHSCKHWLTRLVNHRRLFNLLLSVFHGNVLQFSYIPQYVNLALPNSSERRVTSHYAVLEIQFKKFISC